MNSSTEIAVRIEATRLFACVPLRGRFASVEVPAGKADFWPSTAAFVPSCISLVPAWPLPSSMDLMRPARRVSAAVSIDWGEQRRAIGR